MWLRSHPFVPLAELSNHSLPNKATALVTLTNWFPWAFICFEDNLNEHRLSGSSPPAGDAATLALVRVPGWRRTTHPISNKLTVLGKHMTASEFH